MTAPPAEVTYALESLSDTIGYRLHMRCDSKALSYRDWLTHLMQNADVRDSFTAMLASLPLPAFAWECRPVQPMDIDQPLTMVAIASPALERAIPDAEPFAAQLELAGRASVVSFPNLSGDAQLIVPTRLGDAHCYTHLASFVRTAPNQQQQAFWIEVARSLLAKLSDRSKPLWVSTAGLGVSWLHVRLDERPKYYRHSPFRPVQ